MELELTEDEERTEIDRVGPATLEPNGGCCCTGYCY